MGPIETGVDSDLRAFPAAIREGGIAATVRGLARELDTEDIPPRERAGYAREIRQGLTTLRELAPGRGEGDKTDELKDRREQRLRIGGRE